MRDIRTLAKDIGPREGTSAAFYQAADLVQDRLDQLGYVTSRQSVRAPAGVSWGVPVEAGRSVNVIASPPGVDAGSPHLVVGAHLDTVPQAPGAEDNASGVAVVLELARLAARAETRLPVRFVAFGAEEPRGEGEAWHHFGSKHYVRAMDPPERRAMRGMVSLDRVGVPAPAVPVCTGGVGSTAVQRSVLDVARTVDVPADACVNTGSDHYSFELKGMGAARIGGVSYSAYHSAADLPRVVDPDQLDRVGRITWAWLAPPSTR
jgi:Zn-dependent M28 family amino/carboxypeptidase